jgi:DNA polymerase III subunit epsilon
MVTGQPPLADVLPRFGEFVDGSVPVAHLSSFDLQFLNPRLAALGRPPLGDGAVLDTLLLSCSLFPSWGNYNLEQLAERLDLTVVGRHTSLGDALTTAEILVRLLGVLEQRGVRTLEEALKLQRGDAVSRLVETLRAKQSWG